MFAMTGSQADRADRNKVTLLKLSDMQKTQTGVDDEDEEDDDDQVDEDPTIEHASANHQGCVNRIRSMPQNAGVVATMSDTSQVHVFDFSDCLRSMMAKGPRVAAPTKPAFSFRGHRSEGYALDWSPAVAGRLATGDCAGAIHVWNSSGSSWQVEAKALTGHTGSVEDIQWSPTEGTVFSSASSDNTVRIWDTRGKTGPQISIDAHQDDVNVISWNRSVAYLLASGCEDGSFKVLYGRRPDPLIKTPSHLCFSLCLPRCGTYARSVTVRARWRTSSTTKGLYLRLSGRPTTSPCCASPAATTKSQCGTFPSRPMTSPPLARSTRRWPSSQRSSSSSTKGRQTSRKSTFTRRYPASSCPQRRTASTYSSPPSPCRLRSLRGGGGGSGGSVNTTKR